MTEPKSAPLQDFLARTMVLIPALNEAEVIQETVYYWKNLGVAAVRVVNNGSSDRTAEVARGAGAEVFTERTRGYGAACWTGLQDVPRGIEWVLFSSADGSDQLNSNNLQDWQGAIDHRIQFILGDRFSLPEARRHLKWIQRFGNHWCCWLMFLGWGHRFNDMGSLRLIGLATLRDMALRDRGFGWNIEMQVRAIEQRLRTVELPVPYLPRRGGQSKISGSFLGTIRAGWGMMRIIARLWLRRETSAALARNPPVSPNPNPSLDH